MPIGHLAAIALIQADVPVVFSADYPGLVDVVEIEIVDHVTGGCFTNASVLARSLEQILENDGIRVQERSGDNSLRHPRLLITASGFEDTVNGGQRIGCSGALLMQVNFSTFIKLEGETGDEAFLQASVTPIETLMAITEAGTLNDSLLEAAEEFTRQFAIEVSSRRETGPVAEFRALMAQN